MTIRVGLVGLPNVGKSTLFNILTRGSAMACNYPFCTIKPNIGEFIVEDERLDKLVEVDNPANIVRETIDIVDIAGLVKGASEGEGLGNQFLANIREVDMILHVVRCFENKEIIHVHDNVNPLFDKEIIEYELQIKDLETVNKRIDKVERLSRSGEEKYKKELNFLLQIKDILQQGKNVRELDVNDPIETSSLHEMQLLSAKPVIFIANVEGYNAATSQRLWGGLQEQISPSDIIFIPEKDFSTILELDNSGEDVSSFDEYKQWKRTFAEICKRIYDKLGIISFFTSGADETRAWEIKIGTNAIKAAGNIHTDFEKNFIKAEVVSFEEYYSARKNKIKPNPRIEGKDYIMHDGDVVFFKIKC